jgi:malate dehydrogenase (oxaloacetate-decarboxylating)(NADP+)
MQASKKVTEEEANHYHSDPTPGKFKIVPTKPMNNQRDLSLAYSPGVAVPCLEIHANPEKAFDYTNKGNIVAVISNGTAVLGLGNLGALAGKPVMEGKAVLFNKFAGINSIDLCIDAYTVDEVVDCVKFLGPSFGGINLEDFKGPDCFEIEERLKKLMNIPVFHDDQHGTAIICLAGLINACESSGKKFEDLRIVCNGAGAAGIACTNLIQSYGARK